LAARGCRLGMISRDGDKLSALADEIRRTGTEVCFEVVDLRQRDAVHDAVAAVSEALGPADVLIHNAGIGRVTCAWDPDSDDAEEMLRVNYLAGVYAVEAVLPAMLRRGAGQLVNVSSLAALRGMVWTAGYSASKAAFATFLESLRPALRQRGIATSTCYLGFIRTALSDGLPLNPWLLRSSAEAAARQIVRTVLRRAPETYFPWYDAWIAKLLRRLPAGMFDAVMASAGRLAVKGEY